MHQPYTADAPYRVTLSTSYPDTVAEGCGGEDNHDVEVLMFGGESAITVSEAESLRSTLNSREPTMVILPFPGKILTEHDLPEVRDGLAGVCGGSRDGWCGVSSQLSLVCRRRVVTHEAATTLAFY